MSQQFGGIIPALHTAFDGGGALDSKRQAALVRRLLAAGVHGFFVAGSTGEFAALSIPERERLLELVIAECAGAVPVIAHVGGADAAGAARLARHARKAGAAAVASLPPTASPPGAGAALEHLRAIGAAAELPLFFYHIPSRSGLPLDRELAAGLLGVPGFAGIKYSSGDLYALWRFIEWTGGEAPVLSGFDELLLPFLGLGARGAVGSTYNFLAPLFLELWTAWKGGDLEAARELQFRANRIIDVILRWDNSVSSGKAAMEAVGLPCGDPRPPLRRFTAAEKKSIAAELEAAGLAESAAG